MIRMLVLGHGKVGTALADSCRRAGFEVTHRAARAALPSRIQTDVVVLATRDGAIASLATRLAAVKQLDCRAALHCAGALDTSVLEPLHARGLGVAQMHPLVSLAARDTFGSAWAVVCGDAEGSAWARKIATATGMRVATPKALDRVRYHAAAALMANGAAALAAV